MIYQKFFLVFLSLVFVRAACAQNTDDNEDDLTDELVKEEPHAQPARAAPTSRGVFLSSFENHYPKNPDQLRSGWRPVITFILPGLDQMIEGEWGSGLTYASYGLLGFQLIDAVQNKVDNPGQADISTRDNLKRQMLLGSQMYEMAGAMSAYQSYHSIINIYRDHGVAYTFIKPDETTLDLVTAPFDIRFLKRPTTWAPLAALVIGVIAAPTSGAANFINGSDIGYLSAFSVQAGVAEESVFRGAFMPSLRQWWGSDVWANTAQASIFAALHYSSENKLPLPQFMLGWYFGWLTQKNEYSIRENIFIHAWWDIIAFASTYLGQTNVQRRNVYVPVVDLTF